MKHSLAFYLAPLSALVLGGCYVEDHETVYVDAPDVSTGADGGNAGLLATIDSDATLVDLKPGGESGLYVEYLSGGLWTLTTTCGEVSTYGECEWDIQTTVAAGSFVGAEGLSLDAGETIATDDVGAWTIVYTGNDFDGLYVQTTPGSTLLVDALLDGYPAEGYIFWVEGGEVSVAPVNPVELEPDIP